MKFDDLDCRQREVVDAVLHSNVRRILVLGGPGTGKTATALWTARAHLETSSKKPVQRVLFLTFSRSAVSQIVNRLPGVLSNYEDRIEILTFHALAHRLLRAFGRYASYGTTIPPVQSEARRKLLGCDRNQLQYEDFIPIVLKILEGSERIRQLLSQRWGLVICDEVQDTSEDQWRLLQTIALRKLLLLGDDNQMIYTFLPGISPEQFSQMRNWVDQEIELKPHSHRDTTGGIPALAEAIRKRQFHDEAIVTALRNGNLKVHLDTDKETVPDLLSKLIRDERQKGSRDIGVFSQANADVAKIAKQLDAAGINSVLVGIPEAHAEALTSMATQCAFSVGLATAREMRESLGVFLTACTRGQPPPVASGLAGKRKLNGPLEESIKKREKALANAGGGTMEDLAEVATRFRESPTWREAARPWDRAVVHFRRLIKPFSQLPVSEESIRQLREAVEHSYMEALMGLTYSEQGMVKLMNFHQTKGREADTVLLVFWDNDYFEAKREPFEKESRLLNVAISRARQRAILILPPSPHPLVKPFTVLKEVASL